VNHRPVLDVYKTGKNGIIYGLKQAENAAFNVDLLWQNGHFRDQLDWKDFYFKTIKLADAINYDEQYDGFPDEHFRHEFARGESEYAGCAIPHRVWNTPLRVYSVRLNQRTLIYLLGHCRRESGSVQKELPKEFKQWNYVIDQLESRIGNGKEYRCYPDKGGIFLPGKTEPEPRIYLKEWQQN
jgi:hypothetical protein